MVVPTDCIFYSAPAKLAVGYQAWDISRLSIRVAQLPIIIEPTRVELIGLGDEHCMMEPTTGLHYLNISCRKGSIDSWGQLVAKVALAQLPIVVAAHSVDQMVILVIRILADNNSVIIT